jgi:ferredoxin
VAVTYVISEPCIDVKDRSCIEECPVDCIYEGDRMLYIHPEECVDCGACEPVCPVEAIFYDDDVPAPWKDFTAANAAFFTEGRGAARLPGRGGQRWRCGARRRIRRQLSGLRDLLGVPARQG